MQTIYERPKVQEYRSMRLYRQAMYQYLSVVGFSMDEEDINEDGDLLSCCGEILDEDFMICTKCGEHC